MSDISRSTIYRSWSKQNHNSTCTRKDYIESILECHITTGALNVKLTNIHVYKQVGDYLRIVGFNENGLLEDFFVPEKYVTIVPKH